VKARAFFFSGASKESDPDEKGFIFLQNFFRKYRHGISLTVDGSSRKAKYNIYVRKIVEKIRDAHFHLTVEARNIGRLAFFVNNAEPSCNAIR